ncbi:MAG: RNase P modulator RnpM [Christensenellaceae bacterium]
MKHIPERMCLCCRKSFAKNELIRVVKFNDEIFVDHTKSKNGRGAYVCKSPECFKKLIKSKALDRCFKAEVDNAVYEEIKRLIDDETR